MNNSVLPTTIQSKKLIINNMEEFYSAKQCFDLIDFFDGLGWDVEKELVIYQSNMLNTIGKPVYNIDAILYRSHSWIDPIYSKEDFETRDSTYGHPHFGHGGKRTSVTPSQREFPWSKLDIKRLFEKNRPYYYLCYNGSLRPHRVYILNEFFKRDIIKKGLVSCLNSPNGEGLHLNKCKYKRIFKQAKECCGGNREQLWNEIPVMGREFNITTNHPGNVDSIVDFRKLSYSPQDVEIYPIKKFVGSVPMILDIDPIDISCNRPIKDFKLNKGEYVDHRTSDVRHFKDSYFSVVTESVFLSDDVDEEHDYNGECMFITEKTYRALCFHPTIIAGNKGILKYLRKLGFKTFPKFFDESYDDIENDHDRMLAVVKEVDRICKLPIDEVHKMAKNAFYNVLRNQQMFYKYFSDPSWSYAILGQKYDYELFDH